MTWLLESFLTLVTFCLDQPWGTQHPGFPHVVVDCSATCGHCGLYIEEGVARQMGIWGVHVPSSESRVARRLTL